MWIVYYGGSTEFALIALGVFALVFVLGVIKRDFLWGVVRVLEGFANSFGRFFAWAGLLMVLQQIVIVFLQRIFRVAEISFGPAGYSFT
ncbi:MAG: C4-dicarboxylate ABC transporter permease, partial [Rhodovulum sp.]|nr:C4-dicarboxylate ABC transporter permease [Rhodovulum sp.]